SRSRGFPTRKCRRGAANSRRLSWVLRIRSSAARAKASPERNAAITHHVLMVRLRIIFSKGPPLKIHPCVKHWIDGAGPYRKSHRQLKSAFLAAYTERLLLLPLVGPIPCGARIVEDQETAVHII